MTTPIPHWPGRMLTLGGGGKVWLAGTPASGTGSGDPPGRELVLCVHGMSGSATNWTDLMAELAPDFDCAAVDLPGCGHSPPPATSAGYSVTGNAATVARLIETLGGPVHLVGNSMGGAVSVRVAARRPDLVKTLTLISPALPDRKVRGSVAHFPVLALPFAGEWLVRHYSARYPVENRVAGVFAMCFCDPTRLHPDRFALEVEELRRRDALSYEATVLARAARTLVGETLRPGPFSSLWREAGRVTAPSLVLFGSHDRLIHPRLAGRAASTFRDAFVAVLPETGHLAQMERPGLVATLFREMVDGTRARVAASQEASQVPG